MEKRIKRKKEKELFLNKHAFMQMVIRLSMMYLDNQSNK